MRALAIALTGQLAGAVRSRLTAGKLRKGGRADGLPALDAFMCRCWSAPRTAWLAVAGSMLAGLMLPLAARAQTAPGTLISNTAQLQFQSNGATQSLASNTVSVTVQQSITPAALTVLSFASAGAVTLPSVGPTQCRTSSGFTTLPAPVLVNGTVLNPNQSTALNAANTVHGGDPIFIEVTDQDQNVDPTVRDTVQVRVTSLSGDAEVLQLTETGPDTGVFAGYIASSTAAAVAGDCVLEVVRNETLTVFFTDPLTPTNTLQATALVDPYGQVFDSSTGKPVNGARVRLVNTLTGADAVVLGDDGVSHFPSSFVTGNPVTDSGGTTYTLPAGVFRFPLVAPGSYELQIQPPAGYAFPSVATSAALQLLPGAPYRLSNGSYGKPFTALVPPAVAAIDVPVDPTGTQLFVQKSTTATAVAVGDFAQYTISVQNAAGNGPFRSVTVTDTLPQGLRLRSGSVRINNVTAPDPGISADGHQLKFITPQIAPGAQVLIQYVTEVVAGAQGTRLTNTAQGVSQEGVVSNLATVTVQLHQDLFQDAGVIVGRVMQATCEQSAEQAPGVAGIRVYLEDGRYAVTDKEGKYHFEGVMPADHVVQIDTATVPADLQIATCDARQAGRAYSQFVTLRGGMLWRADFRLAVRPPPTGTADIELASAVDADNPDQLIQTLHLHTGAVPLQGLRLRIVLPMGLSYVPDSATLNGAATANPQNDADVLSFLLGASPAQSTQTLTVHTLRTAGPMGGLNVKAFATFATAAQVQVNTPVVTNVLQRSAARYASASYRFTPHFDPLQAQLQDADRAQLDAIAGQWRGVRDIEIGVVGHTDSTRISRASRSLYADNYALSKARAQSVADYLRTLLGVDPLRVRVAGKGPDEPLRGGRDAASLAANRRVEITINGERQSVAESVSVAQPEEHSAAVATTGSWQQAASPAAIAAAAAAAASQSMSAVPHSNREETVDVETLSADAAWVLPVADAQPSIPSIKVAIAHAIGQSVELKIDGHAVSPLNYDGLSKNLAGTVALSRWRGVNLVEGDNHLVATIRDAAGHELTHLERTVHFGDGAVRAEVVREQSVLSADGTTRPLIVLRLFDRFGKPARNGTIGAFTVDAPYRSWFEVQTLHDNQLVAIGQREPTFEVGRDGLARVELEPTAQAGTATLHLHFSDRHQQDVHLWLEPQAREWILVGIASGTLADTAIRQNMQAASDAGLEDGYSKDGRVAFFAKGAIKGNFLLTASYDSDRPSLDSQQRLLSTVEPNRYYEIYGDATEQRFESPSSAKLYLKIERGKFYAMFGDYQTGLNLTDLSRYNRTFTGIKTEYAGERVGFTGFATNTDQNFAHDELAGDGTSGLYHLSHQNIIINSDRVRIEVRDRFRTELVVATRNLSQYLDYSLDYLNGTIFFREPVASHDENFNPQIIVAEYETIGGTKSVTAGGRVTVRTQDQHLEVGATMIEQGADAGNTLLSGLDLRWNATESTRLRAEFAHTDSQNPLFGQANAYLAEFQHVNKDVDTRIYVRDQQPGFGLEQQLTLDAGARRVGADGRWKFWKLWNLRGEAYRENVLSTGAQRDLAAVEVNRNGARELLTLGAHHVEDQTAQAPTRISDQAYLGGSMDLWQDRLRLRARQELTLGGHDASSDYPTRSILGADYRYSRATTFFTDYEHADGAQIHTDTTRLGVRSTPWEHAQLQSSLGQQFTEYGPRLFSTLGLTQGWQPDEHWTFDFGADQTSTLRGSGALPLNPAVPPASGTLGDDFFATFIGALYRTPLWTVSSRLEHRNADSEDRWLATSGFYREPLLGHAFSLAANLLDSTAKTRTGSDNRAATITMSWAYRPVGSRWIVLDRLDLKAEHSGSTGNAIVTERVVDNFNSSWQIDARTQLGLQLALRYSGATFSNDHYAGVASLTGFDFRHDLTRQFDFGVHGTTLQSWNAHVGDSALGLDVGLTAIRNVWISVGYNYRGFADRDFVANRYTARGFFVTFRIKADQDTFRDLSLAALRPTPAATSAPDSASAPASGSAGPNGSVPTAKVR